MEARTTTPWRVPRFTNQTIPPGTGSQDVPARATRPIDRRAPRNGEHKGSSRHLAKHSLGQNFLTMWMAELVHRPSTDLRKEGQNQITHVSPKNEKGEHKRFLPRISWPLEAARSPCGRPSLRLGAMSTPGNPSHGTIRWEPPSSTYIDELENVAVSNASLHSVTPGRGILKTPGRVKTPAPGKTPARTPKRWNNNPNADHRVTSPDNVGVHVKTPGATKSYSHRTPGKTPTRSVSSVGFSNSNALATTPGRVHTTTTTPGGLSTAARTPDDMSSRFSQAPTRVAVETKAKTPVRYRQPMLARKTSDEYNNAASVLSTLPNATQAAYWLRRASREECKGNSEDAKEFLEQGIKRHAEPSDELEEALQKLEAKIATANGGTTRQTVPSVSGVTTSASNMKIVPPSGSFVTVTPVRASPGQRTELECGKTVLTPCRRSARISPDKSPEEKQALLESTAYAYAPNTSLTNCPPKTPGTGKKTSPVQTLDRILASPGSVTMESLGQSALKAKKAEEADLAFEKALVEATDAAKAVTQMVASLTPVRSASKAARSPSVVLCTTATPPAVVTATPPSHVTATRGATPSTAYVLQRQLTPNSEFAALEMAVAFEQAMEGDAKKTDEENKVNDTLAESKRVAEEEEIAAREATAQMLMRQESMRAGISTNAYSPRKPPKSPMGKAAALSRVSSLASASVIGTPSRVLVPDQPVAPESSTATSTDAMLSLSTPTAATSPFVSPGKAARENAEANGESPTNAVAEAVANATPGSVETRRRRSFVKGPSPRTVPLPKTPFDERNDLLSTVTPIAPNVAKLIATPGKGKSTSPISVFARMMAKVIVDTKEEEKSMADAVAAALMDTP